MTLIKNANIILENEILHNSSLLIDGEKIVKIGGDAVADEIIDANGGYVGPGFVDIHVHGGGGAMFYDDVQKATRHFLSHGETTQMPTLYYNLKPDEFLNAVVTIQNAMKEGITSKVIAGFYMEGPYMNPIYGGNPDRNHWKGEIKKSDYQKILDTAGINALVWAIAPEREGIKEFMADAKKANPNTVFAVGHSEATPEQVDAIKDFGVKIMTHIMNATGRPEGRIGTRPAGPDEACLLDDNMYAELICDSGAIHVPASMQKLVLKIKGIDKMILISDSFVSDAATHPDELLYPDLSFDHNGLLSGSKLTLDVATKNFIKHTGVSIPEAFKASSLNPAKAVGIDDKYGSIAEGKIANLVFCNNDLDVQKVMLYGKII